MRRKHDPRAPVLALTGETAPSSVCVWEVSAFSAGCTQPTGEAKWRS